ncbi:hypothetical protein ACJMK2_027647 [Sinanodonta woodiana]|uniref:Uncharacterized protein n=1 Tax=Sinanodonta woodiana TaxID=1069815 RepID=A0ABD3X628_SINWO
MAALSVGWIGRNVYATRGPSVVRPSSSGAHMRQAVQMLHINPTRHATQILIEYLCRQWLDNPVFPAEAWSVYLQKIGTNNDVEGQLVPQLWSEADLLCLAVQFNDKGRERRYYRFE